MMETICPICEQHPVSGDELFCGVCRERFAESRRHGTVAPMSDVLLVMRKLGVDQDRAVRLLGGQP
jgi:hypothetical protein